jgi:hypothetical protein
LKEEINNLNSVKFNSEIKLKKDDEEDIIKIKNDMKIKEDRMKEENRIQQQLLREVIYI